MSTNPNKMYSVIFPYQVSLTLEADGNETEIIIKTKSEEYYSASSVEDCRFQKEQSDEYSKTAFIKHLIEFVINELYGTEPDGVELLYTGDPIIEEMAPERLEHFERELVHG